MAVIKPELSEDNEISLSFGFKIKLRQVFSDGIKTEVNLIESPEEDVFNGVFDVDDIDFEMLFDNTSNDRNVRIGVKLMNTPSHSYVIRRGQSGILKALESNGKHLHFLSQTTSEGQLLVGMIAKFNKMRIKEAAVECSKIQFTVEVEEKKKTIKTTIGSGFRFTIQVQQKQTTIRVFVTRLTKDVIVLYVGLNQTIGDMKNMIEVREGIPRERQRLIFCGHELGEEKTLSGLNIENDTNIHLVLRPKKRTPIDGQSVRGRGLYIGMRSRGRARGRAPPTAVRPLSDSTSDEEPEVIGLSGGPDVGNRGSAEVDNRGVVCFGKTTDQKFHKYEGFVASKEYDIKPFTIELRLKSKYSVF